MKHTTLKNEFAERDDGMLAFKQEIQTLNACHTVQEFSDKITAYLKQYATQATPFHIDGNDIALLAQAQIALELLKNAPANTYGDESAKQDAYMIHSDNIRGMLTSLLCHKDQTGIPDAKIILDDLTTRGRCIITKNYAPHEHSDQPHL